MGAGNDKLLTISCHPGKQNKKHETTNEEEDSMSNLNNVMKEFKAFILKGNIIDMAVGVIIGGAFSKIVTSLVNDILMPVLVYQRKQHRRAFRRRTGEYHRRRLKGGRCFLRRR